MVGALQTVRGLIVVCERQPYWTPALQRELLSEPFHVRGCPSLRELDRLISTHPKAMVVMDLEADSAGCLAWLSTHVTRPVPSIICGSPSTSGLEPLCRELGALSFLPDYIPRSEMAALCRRWLTSVL